ncbi:hypothetical protein AG1IA_00981 [Rhizoctonia solani AG-1 IA]|uniref:Uncharacterized protein n=1 Tax=Thanatephorus cucumeris (strain AG1-IA) TaxID=983506 RepID=L8X3V1_THACA|nr:hypothetical protein AG1IA_00981 [Rhizoctonia solani AG-1 IA]
MIPRRAEPQKYSGSGVRTHDAFRQEKSANGLKPPVLTTSLYLATPSDRVFSFSPPYTPLVSILLLQSQPIHKMLFKTSAIIALAVAPYAFAQNEAIQLQSIIAQFKNAKLTPEPLPTFSPTALLGVTYGSSAIDPGKPQTVDGRVYSFPEEG